jgi:O-methyltransferase
MNELIKRVRDSVRPLGSVDAFAAGRVVGWATGKRAVVVEARVNGDTVALCRPTGQRPDVATVHRGLPRAATSGFTLELPPEVLESDRISRLEIVATAEGAFPLSTTLASFDIAGAVLEEELRAAPASEIISPFPRDVTEVVAARWPEDCANLQSKPGQARFVRRLGQLLAMPGLNSIPALAGYSRYLNATLAHCRFVEKHFPVVNPRAATGAADFHCKPNSVAELFPIIHQLYVLRSYGIDGDFAEFGCFKGYSSSMLSFACGQLGIPMHIFDSFKGLPPAEGSGYEEGQYAGSLEEVRENVTRFGQADVVQFHEGFFSDSLRVWRPPALMCLWMDVDLESSARDLMVVADRLDRRGTVFSHECPASIFNDGEIVAVASPDNPIVPMVDRFDELGRPLKGQHVSGYTGAFWARDFGIPVLPTDMLFELVRSCA